MDLAKKYIKEKVTSVNKDLLIKIVEASIIEESNFENLVNRIDKVLINAFNDQK